MSSKQSTGIPRLFLSLSLFALLISCGGGSSGGDTPLSSDKAITAFGFTAAANMQLEADLTGTIDEANGTILLAGSLDEGDVSGLKASFTITGKEVSVEGVVQESGVTENSFAEPLTYRVTAGDGSTTDYRVCVVYWKHPSGLSDNISPDGQGASLPQVAMDNNGNALIVWNQYDGSYYQIFMSEYRDGAWTLPAGLSDSISPDGLQSSVPTNHQVAMDDNGNALIVWQQYVGSISQIFMSEYRDGAWTHPEDQSDNISPNEEHASLPQVAMDNNGNALIAWQQDDGSNYQIFMSEYRDGTWTHPEDLSSDNSISPDGPARSPRVAMDNNGNALIAWRQYDGSNWQIFMSEYRDGMWTHPEDLSSDNSISPDGENVDAAPRVAMDDSGNALIAWRQDDGSNYQIFMSEYRDGAWTHPEDLNDNISPDGLDAQDDPRVAMDNNGNALITWAQHEGDYILRIFMSEYRDGAWAHPATSSDSISLDGRVAEDPRVAMDDNGNAVIVWEQENEEWYYRIFRSEYRNGTWSRPEGLLSDSIGPVEQDAYNPRVAMDDSGNAVIVWSERDSSSNSQVFKSEYRFWWEE